MAETSLQKMQTFPAIPDQESDGPWSRELIKAIAMDIGKEVVAYIEVMYPKAIQATSSTFKLSVRNSIHNEIISAIEVSDKGQIESRIRDRKKFRREWTGAYRKMRKEAEAEPTDDITKLREIAERIKLHERGWLPELGYVKNVTFTVEEAATVERALNFVADMEATAINPADTGSVT